MFVLHGGQGRQGELERWKLFLGFNRGVILFLQAGEVTIQGCSKRYIRLNRQISGVGLGLGLVPFPGFFHFFHTWSELAIHKA